VYDPTTWRLVTGEEARDLGVEGGIGLAHTSIPECLIYENFGRGFTGIIKGEAKQIAPEIWSARYFFSNEGLLLFIVYGASIHLAVPTYGWRYCQADAEATLQSYTLAPISD